MMKYTQTNRGFSFVETLVGISILLVGLAMPLTVAYKTLQAAQAARDEITAFYLAQEGIEYVRYVRDTNILTHMTTGNPPEDWLRELALCSGANPCQIDDVLDSVNDAGQVMRNCGGGCDPVEYDTGTRRFGWSGTYATIFTRSIVINEVTDNEEMEATVTVTWRQHGGPVKSTAVRERLFNWTGLSP